MYSLARLGVGLIFAILKLSPAQTDEPVTTQFQTIKLETLVSPSTTNA